MIIELRTLCGCKQWIDVKSPPPEMVELPLEVGRRDKTIIVRTRRFFLRYEIGHPPYYLEEE